MSLWSLSENTSASWQPGNSENIKLLENNNINTNWKYRSYMVKNSDEIIKINQINACKAIGLQIIDTNKPNSKTNTPFLYKSFDDVSTPRGYEMSNAKMKYISEVTKEKQMATHAATEKKISIVEYLRNLF
jgi:hypothetical protein